MYNIDFLPQLETSRRHLFRSSDPHNLSPSVNYYPPSNIKAIECVEDVNGEWVLKRALEGKVSTK